MDQRGDDHDYLPAVLTAIAAARGTAGAAKTQLLTANEASQWAYYQAKSIKESMAESQKNFFELQLLGDMNVIQKAAYVKKLAMIDAEVARYSTEKTEIKFKAEATGHSNQLLTRKNIFFSASVVFLQIAIMLSSVSALLKKRFMWYVGLVFGVIGMVLLGYGLFLPPLFF